MAATVIRNFIAKALFKKKGAIANNKSVDFSANALEQRLKNLGIDPNAITSEKELNQILSYVKQAEDQAFNQRFGDMLGGSKFDRKGEVFDMSGKKLDSSRGIMGGTQIDEKSLKEGLMKTDNPFSDLVKTTEQGPKTLAEREAEVLARLEKENKAAAQRIRDRKADEKQFNKDVEEAGGMEEFLNKNPIDDDTGDFAQGGRVGLMAGSVPKIFTLLKNPKKVKQAIDNIFPTGDVKYDATMAAESLVELNPKIFGNKLYDDLDSITRLDIYDAVISPMMSAQAKALRMKKATKPEKTLQSMKEGKGINMSDPEIAKEFEQFMRQTDPEGVKKLEQTFELDNFDPKGRKKNATGGRIGFKDGMTRRSFLKILGGLAAIPIVGKFLKPIKTAKGIKSVPIIKTDNVAGKPEWFDALVNKVIIEGDDVTKRFATADRQSIHQKTLDDGSVVRVTEDVDDGAVRVEYDSDANVFEDTVQMEYKKPLPDEGAPNPAAEFSTAESGPVGRQVGPDDYDMDIDEVGGSSIRDLDSDVSKLKEYATGKGPTMREIIQNKKRKDRAKAISEDPEAQSDAIVRRQGEMLDYDVPDDAFASGGIARMLGE